MHYQRLSELIQELKHRKEEGQKIVFTNGVFDILHLGHVSYLEEARKLGDFLVVGINDDASVRLLNKGPERPIHDERARAEVLASLRCVDATIIFPENTPATIIEAIQPNVLVKGGDYDADETNETSKKYIVGSKETRQRGGKVICIPLVAGYSTTIAVQKINENKG
jgi:D-beta-D-heptose 7-phosphate kinase/D-beta-D-heptose 1-phosphate adenosyltransferase